MKFTYFAAVMVVSLAACSANTSNSPQNSARSVAFSKQLSASSTGSLCATYTSTATTPLVKMMLEAELGARNIAHCSRTHVGGQSVAQYKRASFSRANGEGAELLSDKDCSDFPSGAHAQRFFLAVGGPSSDPHRLDRDGDGLACEWGTAVTRLHSKALAPIRRASPRRTSSSRCYVGPRGGTYTISASGNKNYGGC